MIYVDTVSGNLTIDTETAPGQRAIVITRDAAGMYINYSKKVKTEGVRQEKRLSSGVKNKSLLETVIQW